MSWGNVARRIHNVGIVGYSALLVACAQLAAAQEMWLVTPEEAALAPAPEDSLIRSRGLTSKDPRIDVLKPASDAPQQSPIKIQIRFYPTSAPVRLESVKVQLVKFISIDITDRVKPYLSETGIEVKEAKIPSGSHIVRISVADERGERSTMELKLEVKLVLGLVRNTAIDSEVSIRRNCFNLGTGLSWCCRRKRGTSGGI